MSNYFRRLNIKSYKNYIWYHAKKFTRDKTELSKIVSSKTALAEWNKIAGDGSWGPPSSWEREDVDVFILESLKLESFRRSWKVSVGVGNFQC